MKKPSIQEHLNFFKLVSLFQGLDEAQIKKIMAVMTITDVKKDDMITREGEHGDSMFILLKGQVEISKSLFMSPLDSEDSLQEKSLVKLSEDQHAFFGEMALFLENPERSASIRALRPCRLAGIQKKELLAILAHDHYLASTLYRNIATELTKRLIKANRDILKLTTAFSLAIGGE